MQEKGRALAWDGHGQAAFAVAGAPVDLSRQTNGDMAVALRFRVDTAPDAPVSLAVGCGQGCAGNVDATALFKAAPVGQWRTLKIKLSCFRNRGAEMSRVDAPVAISTAGRFDLSVSDLRLASNEGDAVCPTT